MADASTIDFFGHQDIARRKTSLLIGYYAAAVALIVLAVYAAFAFTFAGAGLHQESRMRWEALWNPELFFAVTGATVLVVLAGSAYRIRQLAEGGEAVARLLGGKPLAPDTRDAAERRVLNIVEEMAIASGTPVPRVFVLPEERGINAFAAGFTPSQAVIGVTRGCMDQLTRDELQGVIGHEFSHILNGDMRLNIRLLGVLNGILVIAIVGYWIFRSAAVGGGRSRRNKGSPLPLLILGLTVMAVGYIGVFFGRLIKSAVSRQREYLADAAAVQFTRNPQGLAAALKKIGGYKPGSRLQTAHADEASHFFFANGLRASAFKLMATHPRLLDRIRRLDPAFDGTFDRLPRPPADSPAAPSGPVSALHPGGAAARVALQPDTVVRRVGMPGPEHLVHAVELMDRIPVPVKAAAHEPFGARAVVYGVLLGADAAVRSRQLAELDRHADPAVMQATRALMEPVRELDAECRLPLAEMALNALKALSEAQYRVFLANVDRLVKADQQVDLFEYALQRIVRQTLDPVFGRNRRGTIQYYALQPLLPDCAQVLSCLAYAGADDRERAAQAYAQGIRSLGALRPPALLPLSACGLQALDTGLVRLSESAPQIRKRVLTACVACVAADGFATVDQTELLRAVAGALECPLPPLNVPVRLAA